MIRPWSEIEDFYRELVRPGQTAVLAMMQLVGQIKNSPYAQALNAWTSMLDLCIAQVPCNRPYDGPFLRISPRGDGTVEFRYMDTAIEARQWHRIVKEDEAFQRLERFIDQLHWVARERKRDPALSGSTSADRP
jgi:hypothetical protein